MSNPGYGTPLFRNSSGGASSSSADSSGAGASAPPESSSPPLDLNNLKQEIVLKILVLGDLGVGKTALVKRYTDGDASGR